MAVHKFIYDFVYFHLVARISFSFFFPLGLSHILAFILGDVQSIVGIEFAFLLPRSTIVFMQSFAKFQSKYKRNFIQVY